MRLDQPLGALEVYRSGLDKFPNDVSLMTGMARIYEVLGNISLSASYYKKVLGVSTKSIFMASADVGRIIANPEKRPEPDSRLSGFGKGLGTAFWLYRDFRF